jgi:hypothetical protein
MIKIQQETILQHVLLELCYRQLSPVTLERTAVVVSKMLLYQKRQNMFLIFSIIIRLVLAEIDI